MRGGSPATKCRSEPPLAQDLVQVLVDAPRRMLRSFGSAGDWSLRLGAITSPASRRPWQDAVIGHEAREQPLVDGVDEGVVGVDLLAWTRRAAPGRAVCMPRSLPVCSCDGIWCVWSVMISLPIARVMTMISQIGLAAALVAVFDQNLRDDRRAGSATGSSWSARAPRPAARRRCGRWS